MTGYRLLAATALSLLTADPGFAQPADPNTIPPQYVTGHDAMTARSLRGQVVPVPQSAPLPRDVIVIGRRRCRRGDEACIDRVSTELWTKYPDQIRQLCTQTEIHAIREGFVEQELGMHGVRNDHLTPATQRLCQFGSKVNGSRPPRPPAATPVADTAGAEAPPPDR